MPASETETHQKLKRLALAWARQGGFAIATTEVRVPRSGYRADVAAIGRGTGARCAVFECKQARADLLRDAHDEEAVRAELAELIGRRANLEALLSVHRPDLRKGETLFPEYDAWDFSGLEHQAYHTVLARLATLQARVGNGVKFARMLRHRCADFLYLVVEGGIYAEAEIPAGWGLLVRRDEDLELRRKPAALDATAGQRHALLEAIALAASLRRANAVD
jgi:hypothetical protein